MQKRIAFILFFIITLLYTVNHFVINWEKVIYNSSQNKIDKLILSQRNDLLNWIESGESSNDSFSKRLYCSGKLLKWSDDKYLISIPKMDTLAVTSDGKGVYLVQKYIKESCVYISFHELCINYSITNKYLNYEQSFWLDQNTSSINLSKSAYNYRNLFTYDLVINPNKWIDAIATFCLLFLVLFLFWYFGKESLNGFLISLVFLIGVRLLSLYFNFFSNFIKFTFFDSINFTYDFFNPNLGDLLINLLIQLVIIAVFFKYHQRNIQSKLSVFICLIISWLFCLQILYVVNGLEYNSQVIFNLSRSIRFDLFRFASYFSVILVCLIHFIFTLLVSRMIIQNFPLFWKYIYFLLFLVLLFGFIDWIVCFFGFFHVFILSLIVITSENRANLSFFKQINSHVLLFFVIIISGLLSYEVFKHENKSDLEAKKKYANHLLLKRDILSEYYLGQVLAKIKNDSLIDSLVMNNQPNDLLNRLNKEYYINPFFDKYQINLVIEDISKINISDNFRIEHENLVKKNQSDYGDIFFVDEQTKLKYVCRLIKKSNVCLIIFDVKKRLPNKVYPSLLTDSKFTTVFNNYDYAIFDNEKLLNHKTKFGKINWNKLNHINNSDLYEDGFTDKENHYFGITSIDGRKIIIASKKNSFRTFLVNFSFFFLVLSIFYWLGLLSFSLFKKQNQFYLSSKIQLFMGFALLFPLVTSGVILLNSLNSSYQEELNRSFIKKAANVSDVIFNYLNDVNKTKINAKKLAEISSYIQEDVSYYDSKGLLVATSQPEIFNLKLKSKLINPIVFEKIKEDGQNSLIAEQKIGNLEYKICYSVIGKGISNESLGYIAIPFFESKRHMQVQQVEVFENLIIVFGLIFIFISFFGDSVIKSLLKPLYFISDKIKHFNIQKENKPIDYQSSDEIGLIIKGYNEMLLKLETSKKELAKTQKETAWKEIAKQVAHEIKNPLMPMRLKIQQIIRRDSLILKDKNALESMIEQIDTLSHIATSFSAFADMPALNREVFNWGNFIENAARIYNEQAKIMFDLTENVYIYADKDIFQRVINNIILNAIQASKPSEKLEIQIVLSKNADKALLEIKDNGCGIPEEIQDKVFIYQFTTKSEGSGIGLAVAKKGIENAGGSIWFETQKNEGTSFFISMPLAVR